MLANVKHAKEIWGGSLSIIDSWLNARQDIVVLYCELAGISGGKVERKLPEQSKVTEFCGLLLDYASKGHFEIYEQIIEQCKLDGEENLKLAQELYSRITTTTDTALNFNDKYAENAT
ncbi:MAG: sigma D regulator, partial [Psychromonas sp.]|nr:sigma D regulator [Psychromonas sp.]